MRSSSQRADMMLNQPISSVIPRLAVPTIISMLVTSIYNMADTFFVGQISTAASGAVGVTFSAMAMIQAIAFTIGMGSGANMSRALGAQRRDEAQTFVSVGFFTAVGVGVLIAVVCNLLLEPLVSSLGATPTILPHAMAYASYIFYAAPFMMGTFVMNNHLRFQGLALYGMLGTVTGGLLNIALDPLFIFRFGLGTAGAAIATAISQFVSFCILLCMTNLRSDTLRISPKYYKPTAKLYGRILSNGLPSLGRQGIASIATIVLNKAAAPWGDAAIAAMAIVSKCVMFINSSVIGFGQGFQPVCAFCYGAKKYARVREAFWYCVRVSTCILLVLGAVAFVFARPIVTVFRREDAEVIAIGALALRMQLCTIPLWGFIVMSNMLTQSIGYGFQALLISCTRQGLCLIPALLILPPALGLVGLQMAQPVSDLFAFLITLIVVWRTLKQMKRLTDGV